MLAQFLRRYPYMTLTFAAGHWWLSLNAVLTGQPGWMTPACIAVALGLIVLPTERRQ